LLDAEPPLPSAAYEDVVEVSVTVPDRADVRWSSWAAETSGKLKGIAPDSYRLRVSAQGRDAGHQGEFAEDVVDEYVLELWPAGRAEDAIIRVGSENARYWHRELGARR
nr:hypothetical protein [Actinomycetota bacterium]